MRDNLVVCRALATILALFALLTFVLNFPDWLYIVACVGCVVFQSASYVIEEIRNARL